MAKSKSNGKLDDPRIDELVGWYVEVRSEKRKLEKELKKYEEMLGELSGHLLAALDASGVESARTDLGTVTASMRYSARLEDPDAFMKYVADHGAYELMDRKANSTACREFAEENDALPPGVVINSMRTVSVREPS